MSIEQLSLAGRARVHAALGEPARLAIVDALAVGDVSPGEIADRLGLATNLVAHHVQVLQDAGVLVRTRSEGDRRRTYLRLVPGAISAIAPPPLAATSRILFVCTHNSARSQLAAAMWPRRSAIPVVCAGTQPAARVHPRAARIARRHGLSLARARTAHVADVRRPDDLVVAVCDTAHEHLAAADSDRLHWSVPDPAGADTDEAFESAYAELAERIDRLAPALVPPPRPGA
ncbi:MarR family transcriptional regulator [Actinopolymorpha sp. B17G11]|uniref:arsenate reductase/protein-tyrosine-phosphatase family protein n=1 Tax=Actinopolymorpha sp. B17G11 TaxID=3160861 RepID=UPI0032E37B2E